MDSALSQRLSEMKDVRSVLRALTRMEIRSGTFKVSSASIQGMFSFQNGYIVSAATSGDRHAKDALLDLLRLPECNLQFASEDTVLQDRRDEMCLRMMDLIDNHFVLDGLAWAPRHEPRLKAPTGQTAGFVNTGSDLSMAAGGAVDMVHESRATYEANSLPLGNQRPTQPAYDLSALDAIPTPGAPGSKAESWGQTAPQAAPPAVPATPPAPDPDPPATSYDLSALDAIPTPGAGKAGSLGQSAPQPHVAPQPAAPQPHVAPQAAPPSYDLSALDAIPTQGAGGSKMGSWGQSAAGASPAPAQPAGAPQAQAQAPQASFDRSALDSIPTPGSGGGAAGFDRSALDSIPTPGAGGAPKAAGEAGGFIKKMSQQVPSPAVSPSAPPPEPSTPSRPMPAQQGAARGYTLEDLNSIPTPSAKPATPGPRPQADSGPIEAPSPLTTGSHTSVSRRAAEMEATLRDEQYRMGTSLDRVPAGGSTESEEYKSTMQEWQPEKYNVGSNSMYMYLAAGLVILCAIMAFALPQILKSSVAQPKTEPAMNGTQLQQFVTDQVKDEVPYAH
jgi:hypothetical protein